MTFWTFIKFWAYSRWKSTTIQQLKAKRMIKMIRLRWQSDCSVYMLNQVFFVNVNVRLCSFCKFTHWLMTESLTHCYDRKRRKLKLLLSGIGIGSWQMRPNQSGWVLWFPIPWFALILKIYYLNEDCGITLFMQLRNPKEVTKEEYNEFYKKTFNEYLEPLASSHFTTEVRN